jgi:hypothetical protein
LKQHPQPANVVAMLMGDHNGIELFGVDPDRGKAAKDLACAQSSVDQNGRRFG